MKDELVPMMSEELLVNVLLISFMIISKQSTISYHLVMDKFLFYNTDSLMHLNMV